MPKYRNLGALFCALLLLCLTLPTLSIAQPQGCSGCDLSNNLISYGDFSIALTMLPVPASSSLNPLCDCNYPDGTAGFGSYCIEIDADDKCISFDNILDHTNPGISRFMVVDGFPIGDVHTPTNPNIVWKDEVFVPSAGTYEFSFWCMPNLSSYTSVTPVFDFRVDYVPVVTNIGTSPTLYQWNEYCFSVNIPTAGLHVLEIAQTNNGDISNDYGIDDIFFGNCCECSVIAGFQTFQSGPAFTVDFTDNSSYSSCTTPYNFTWDFGDGSAPVSGSSPVVSHTYPGPGWYVACMEVWAMTPDGQECFGEVCREVFVPEVDQECNLTADFTIISGLPTTQMVNSSTDPTTIDQWTWTIYDPYLASPYSITSSTVGSNAATSPGWSEQFTPNGPGSYTVCLTVYDYDVPECYATKCFDFEVVEDVDPICDVLAGFNFGLVGAPSTYQFNSTSTASTPITYSWTITDLNSGPGASYGNVPGITHTFINAHTYQVCLFTTQMDVSAECFDSHCEIITINEVSDHLFFTLGYNCDDEPSMYINAFSTSAPSVSITTTCTSPGSPVNNGLYPAPIALPLLVATEPSLTYSTCCVNITTQGLSPNISATQCMYFNCQPCPGTPKSLDGGGIQPQEKPARRNPGLGLTIFPNPSDGNNVEVQLHELSGPTQLQLIDMEGRVIRNFDIDVVYSNLRLPISTQELTPGMYFLRLQTDTEVITEKLIVQ